MSRPLKPFDLENSLKAKLEVFPRCFYLAKYAADGSLIDLSDPFFTYASLGVQAAREAAAWLVANGREDLKHGIITVADFSEFTKATGETHKVLQEPCAPQKVKDAAQFVFDSWGSINSFNISYTEMRGHETALGDYFDIGEVYSAGDKTRWKVQYFETVECDGLACVFITERYFCRDGSHVEVFMPECVENSNPLLIPDEVLAEGTNEEIAAYAAYAYRTGNQLLKHMPARHALDAVDSVMQASRNFVSRFIR